MYRAEKRIEGKRQAVYIGKDCSEDVVREKIRVKLAEKGIADSDMMPK